GPGRTAPPDCPHLPWRMRARRERTKAGASGSWDSVDVRAGERLLRLLHGLTLGDELLIAFLVEVGDGEPGVRHLIGRSRTPHNPLVRIGIVRVARRIVMNGGEDHHRTRW